MTPAARIQAAIELLSEMEKGDAPADACVRAYFRERRYAGGGDRRAVTERVYGVLRRRGLLMWRLGQTSPTPRALALADLALDDGEAAAALFDGGAHAPAPLDAAERALLPHLTAPAETPPDWALGNYPAWLDGELRRRFADNVVAEMRALDARAAVDLRVNTLKAAPAEVLARLAAEDIEAAPGRWSPLSLRLAGRADLRAHTLFRDGLVEPQDEASQLAALLTEAAPGEQVVDYCAGAGGKSLALAAEMRNSGQVYALDVSARRLEAMAPRLQRAGVRNVQTRTLNRAAEAWLAGMAGRADRVLADAPCSASGAWRRNPEAPWRLQPSRLDALVATQRQIVASAARLVRPGGRLVYAVCSLLMAEAEDVLTPFLAAHPEFRVRPVAEIWPRLGAPESPVDPSSPYLLMSPARHGTDGFFVAVLERDA